MTADTTYTAVTSYDSCGHRHRTAGAAIACAQRTFGPIGRWVLHTNDESPRWLPVVTTPDERRVLRRRAKALDRVPVRVVRGHRAPRARGRLGHYTTPTGKPIHYPNAYARRGWSSMVYHHSTARVEVGVDWLLRWREQQHEGRTV